MPKSTANIAKPGIVVAVCTYRRNEELAALLERLARLAETRWASFAVGITIIDDTEEGIARSVVQPFADRFELGLVYEISGQQNISVARNRAIEESLARGHWIAMTDDDCLPSDNWLNDLVAIQISTNADVVTGLMLRTAPDHAPDWLKTQPFLQLGEFEAQDGADLPVAFTNNSLISVDFLIRHPDLRFDPSLGKTGGEDVMFFRTLRSAGAKIAFSKSGVVFEKLPDVRMSLAYQLRRYFWHGNSSSLTSMQSGKGRARLAVHGFATMARALTRPLLRALGGEAPQIRFCVAQLCEGAGKIAGVLGWKVKHS